MSEPDDDVTVDAGGVSIRKTLNDHQFETLAVVFDVRSGREHAVDVTITESIPADVSVDDIGFHPEYGGEHWRAEEGTVVFRRTFEPGEQYTTVYGIRQFDDDRTTLLSEPSLDVDHTAVGDSIHDVADLVSEEDSEAVREVITGERETLPGLEEDVAIDRETSAADGATADADAEPGEIETGTDRIGEPVGADDSTGLDDDVLGTETGGSGDVIEPAEGSAGAEDDSDTSTAEEGAGPGVASVDEGPDTADGSEDEDEELTEGVAVAGSEPRAEESEGVTVPVTGGIARVLAKELRAGNVSYEDRRLLREELLPETGSTDARIQRLQNQVADLAAYTDALEQFLDEEGGAEAVMEDVEGQVDELAVGLQDVETTLSDLEHDVDAIEENVDEVTEDVDAVEEDVIEVSAAVDDVSETVGRVERDVESIHDDLDRVEALDRRLESIEDDVSAIHAELEDLATFRDRLSSVFGAGGGPAGAGSTTEGTGGESDGEDGEDGDSSEE